jgi:hypothetical protein
MKRIVIYENKENNLLDIHYNELSNEDSFEQFDGLRFMEASNKIDELINNHDMQPDHRIINYYFDKENNLESMEKMTIGEYLEYQ